MVSRAWMVGLVRTIFRSFVNGDGSYQRKLHGFVLQSALGNPWQWMESSFSLFLQRKQKHRNVGARFLVLTSVAVTHRKESSLGIYVCWCITFLFCFRQSYYIDQAGLKLVISLLPPPPSFRQACVLTPSSSIACYFSQVSAQLL